jgi:1-acyl-sn-glycerol-3-phosphate acyltransferase
VAGSLTHEEAHHLAREKGVSRPLYAIVRGIAVPFMKVYFRLRLEHPERIPDSGAAIVAPNHKSIWDSLFIAAATKRHLRFMGKSELFEGPFGRTLVRLGAFPVRRGQSDEQALETARTILREGGLLSLFPEGTRFRDPDALGTPRRGAARLALEVGAPLVPAAITGTESLFLGPVPKPKRVQVAFGEPISVQGIAPTPEAAGELISEHLWPEVSAEFTRLRARPGLIVAGLTALGLAGFAVRRRGVGSRARRSNRGGPLERIGRSKSRVPLKRSGRSQSRWPRKGRREAKRG